MRNKQNVNNKFAILLILNQNSNLGKNRTQEELKQIQPALEEPGPGGNVGANCLHNIKWIAPEIKDG